mmetsp:Transcript_38764/g.106794  ORF Transcript_38764/g.106794 Transcript_38764/m.106794 type:complete len:125 (-) Transcript_38764:83-457(-)
MYNQIAQIVHERASVPLKMVPAGYPAPKMMQFVATIVGMMQGFLIVAFLVNDKFMPPALRENKMMVLFGVFFGGSMVASALTKTDAFEIYVGNRLLFSKLQQHRMPNIKDLVNGFQAVGVTLSM